MYPVSLYLPPRLHHLRARTQSWLDLCVVSVLQHIAQSADSTESEGYPQAAQRAYIDVQQFTVNIPMPANISLHGRREGLRGRWSTQDHFMRDSLAHWTDLGVMAGDCLLVQKALLVLKKGKIRVLLCEVKADRLVNDFS